MKEMVGSINTTEATKYIQHDIHHEMPCELRKYLEIDLFSKIQLKAGKEISICTAHWLQREGFKYTEQKKSFYHNGDVLTYG